MNLTKKKRDSLERYNVVAEEKPSRLSAVIFFIICVVPLFSITAFGAVDSWALGALSVLMSIVGILWLVDGWLKKRFQYNASPLLIPIAGLILIGLIQLLPLRGFDNSNNLLSVAAAGSLSLDQYSTRLFIVQMIVLFVFFAAALTFINSEKRLRKVVLTLIIFGAAIAFIGIIQFVSSGEGVYGLRLTPQSAPFGPFINRHHFATLMNMTLALVLGSLFGKVSKNDKNILYFIAAFLMLIALILTSSRGGFISLLAVLAFFLVPRMIPRRWSMKKGEDAATDEDSGGRYVRLAGYTLLIFALVGTVLFLGGGNLLFRSIGLSSESDITNGRAHFWSVALKIFLDHPILGAGLNAFGAAFSRYDDWNGLYRVEQAHNDYLQILADAGIIGFACVAGFIYLFFKNAAPYLKDYTQSYRRSVAAGAFAGCLAVFVHSFFDFPLRTPANAFVFLILVVLATASVRGKRRTKPVQI